MAVLVTALLAALATWYVNDPADLPTSERTVRATTPVDVPVYVGMFAGSTTFSRTLELSGVKVHTVSNTDVEVVPLLCRGGTVGVTTDPERFCSDVVDPEGQAFGPRDDIVLRVTSDDPAIAVIDRVRLGFREGLQWGTRTAGSPAEVTVVGR